MLDMAFLTQRAAAAGFTHAAPLDVSTIRLLDEVRAMCRVNSCGAYGHNWSCPPACGELDQLRTVVGRYSAGLLVQTVGQLEDELDAEGMMATEALHKQRFSALHDELLGSYPDLLALGAGGCRRCSICTCPDAPCRFPDKRVSSMEAYGMLVMEVCRANGMGYYYGRGSIAYTSCFLLE